MRGLKLWAIFMLCLAAAISGCGERDLSKPPKIHYSRDSCAQCRMIIGDERFACAAVSPDGHFLKFDDIGCLALYQKGQGGHEFASWVHDAGGAGWLEKEKARFVHSSDLVTPMGYGFAAFASAENAAQFSQEKNGRLLIWNELLSLVEEQRYLKKEEVK